VQQSDTLVHIAVKFDLSLNWIRQVNQLISDAVFKDDCLIVVPPPSNWDNYLNIRIEVNTANGSFPGVLSVIEDIIVFRGNKNLYFYIYLSDFLESSFFPHPSAVFIGPNLKDASDDSLFMLHISYKKYDGDIEYQFFIAKKIELEAFHRFLKNRVYNYRLKMGLITIPIEEVKPKPKNPIKSISLLNGPSEILDQDHIEELRSEFPYRYKNQNWQLLYSLSTHGCSFNTFFERTVGHEPFLMVIRTHKGESIGAFISNPLKKSKEYYGRGETFVFKTNPSLECFKWSKENKYFVSTSKDEIAIGGGGSSAIWIGGDMFRAFSESCSTFNSPQLTTDIEFRIINIEVWLITSQ